VDFSLDDDQRALQDAVRRYGDLAYPLHERTRRAAPEQERRRWSELAELGLTGLCIEPALGGSGLGAVEIALVAQELGRVLAASAWIESAVMCGRLIDTLGTPAQRERWLRPMAEGRLRAALAWHETGTRDAPHTALRATRVGRGWSLTGNKTAVLHGEIADLLLVLARVGGVPGERRGLALFVFERADAGMTLVPATTLDGHGAATLVLDGACVADERRLDGEVATALDEAFDATQAALCAESIGALDMLLALTLEQLRTRRQFGKPLAAFQALQHQVADLFIRIEQARSMAALAAMAVQEAAPDERARLVSAAKVITDEAGRFVGEWAIQLHGAMGMTEECQVAHYVRRLLVVGQRLGTTLQHLQRYGRLAAAAPAVPGNAAVPVG
jgi:alkylation response protein AidB-like acyl-CoA dehydrogenase